MKILIVNDTVIPVTLYGGTERVIWALGKELVNLGHQVVYMVKKGSSCDFASVICIDEIKPIIDQIPKDIDVVHFNFPVPGIEKLQQPYIITMHGNMNRIEEMDRNTVFVSQNHAARYGSDSYVYNGLDWTAYDTPDLAQKRSYFHFLGNAAWRIKNVRGALDIVKQTNTEKLHVLGGVRFNFNMGIRLTFSPKVKFHGMVGGTEKQQLINGSKGLLFPVLWDEPFGLAIIESLYYGCPVFGTPFGSLSELVKGDVGYLSTSSENLANAMLEVNQYSAKTCHEYARENFNSKIMALKYLEKYDAVISNKKLNTKNPKQIALPTTKSLD